MQGNGQVTAERKTALLNYLREHNYIVKTEHGHIFHVYTSEKSTKLLVEFTIQVINRIPTEDIIAWIEQQREQQREGKILPFRR